MTRKPRRTACAALAITTPTLIAASMAACPISAAAADDGVFTLGQITVTGARDDESPVGTAVLDSEELWDFGKDGVAEALNLIPGVSSTLVSGPGRRNESDISLRGFDRTRVLLTMDGIRLFLPADNRIDFGRFLTPDLSEIQVSKGYVSVINGPDGMGGAINLVTRKPVKAFEGEVRYSALLGRSGQHDGNVWYANLGGKQEKFYWQASFQQRDIDGWRLSGDYRPELDPSAPNYQAGGVRNFSDSNDWRGNLKVGFTPNTTDEYSLNYVKQSGEKHRAAPVRGNDDVQGGGANLRVWDWPEWDTSSLYFLSNTQLDAKTYLKTRIYYNTFDNTLSFYTAAPGGGNRYGTLANDSVYDDNSKGFSVELGTEHFTRQTLKASLHYRRDEHVEWNTNQGNAVATNNNPPEPKQSNIESIWSVAVEDTWHVTPDFDLVGGISHDRRSPKRAEEFGLPDEGATDSRLYNLPLKDKSATNYQAAAIWRYRPGGKAHFAISDRTRFPTIAERYSSRFGTAVSNPGLEPERARNYELGVEDDLTPGVRGSAAIFYSKVEDYIQSVPDAVFYGGRFNNQSQNVGTAKIKGLELGITASLLPTLEAGGNFSWIDADITAPPGTTTPYPYLATPKNMGFLYARWTPTNRWSIVPSYEFADKRWSNQVSGVPGPTAVKTGSYELLNLKVEYRIIRDWTVAFAANNLLDKNYELSAGYPSPGRNFVLSTRYQF